MALVHPTLENVSEEAKGATSLSAVPDNLSTLSVNDFDLECFFQEGDFDQMASIDDLLDILNAPNETNEHPGIVDFSSEPIAEIDSGILVTGSLPVTRCISASAESISAEKKDIILSPSVAIGLLPRSMRKVEVVHPLEETYRPRYKSDYFSQSGQKRKPRYVADRLGNHFISLKVPPNSRGQIRIDWLTVPDREGKQHVMPYHFQVDNESSNIPDCNPMFVDINADASGLMKLYLVLIKAKQDTLRSCQPLKPFQPIYDAFNEHTDSSKKDSVQLTPKKLIEKYQLDKSVLAFTFCTWSGNGKSRVIEWQTTVMSTVLTEEKTGEELSTHVKCPKCSNTFLAHLNEKGEPVPSAEPAKKRTLKDAKAGKTGTAKKKKSNEIA